jgi:hypothetical protein
MFLLLYVLVHCNSDATQTNEYPNCAATRNMWKTTDLDLDLEGRITLKWFLERNCV